MPPELQSSLILGHPHLVFKQRLVRSLSKSACPKQIWNYMAGGQRGLYFFEQRSNPFSDFLPPHASGRMVFFCLHCF